MSRTPLRICPGGYPGIDWPAMPDPSASLALAIQFQLEQTQWWSHGDLEHAQFKQLGDILQHAYEHMPYWRQRLACSGYLPGANVSPDWFRTFPILTRGEAQQLGDALFSPVLPPGHGAVASGQTSGSTGIPLHHRTSALAQLWWDAFTLRDHLWHERDLTGTLAAIRRNLNEGEMQTWGPPADRVFVTGKCATLNLRTDIDEQLRWLQRIDPDYLVTNAHNLYWLARRALELAIRVPRLKQARTFGGVLHEDARGLVRKAWNAGVADMYTAEEVGYIALQCPLDDTYHAQSENLVVEIVDDAGRACRPGEIGRVVVTTLHNFAMPLIRYAIGDYAEAGAPCRCGRGLPVLRRILGRQRNILCLPDGRRYWPSFASEKWSHIAAIRQIQLVQKTLNHIEVRVAAVRTMTTDEKEQLTKALQGALGHPFEMSVVECGEIPRAADYKFEDFISEVA